ncbi:hypothetical protein I302_105628 [Kwoniella bestiolae CBS 10118]|uniref:Uncharacterized protein n=1 Tax=Kwoniella bestiolae CBS 10118 TaxID=1296100 RepID=A0A1B9G1N8_9TREE|nr:hypothetical protein I302_04746 [Kwoniella bestiolae CBS 10118]OCF24936.1 hypothetical protein I302_04746 [Kwoniella bestiolae CBS 10118]
MPFRSLVTIITLISSVIVVHASLVGIDPTDLASPTSTSTSTSTFAGLILEPATTISSAQPAMSLKQATRSEIIERSLYGLRAKRGVPSPMPPQDTVYSQPDNYPFARSYQGKGMRVTPGVDCSQGYCTQHTTFAGTILQNTAIQDCANFAHGIYVAPNWGTKGYLSFSLWYDTSVDVWNCEAYWNVEFNFGTWDKVDENADPVYGYSVVA